ncbi:unnamed protein product [Psylliodes chrysocephalus]|uniref:PHD-type domain-containing protein n=1 Tax=Psylliodes chrysocephalus TaxID=3402493 RepID=A0A9P0CN95_9CUCU|nr:unnamed protein product [Psylliodes chrysocephala]
MNSAINSNKENVGDVANDVLHNNIIDATNNESFVARGEITSTILNNGVKVHFPRAYSQPQFFKVEAPDVKIVLENCSPENRCEIISTKLRSGIKIHLPLIESNTLLTSATNIKSVNDDFFSNHEEVDIENKTICANTESEDSLVPIDDITTKVKTIKRNLFFDGKPQTDKKIKLVSNILLRKSDEETFKNEKVTKGLCYNCVKNITSSRCGVRCLTCLRTFHFICANTIQDGLKSKTFKCKSCVSSDP